ncbi:MAG TPA: carbohydrate ABC transporter permease [Actinomycetes bacterium]|jgi:multiple sugar transport system permease protein|nr:carbohydrate ABC transporter permease [Actinomycetes bacterium]
MATDTTVAVPRRAAERVTIGNRVWALVRERGMAALGIFFIALWCLFPFYWMINTSFKVEPEILASNNAWPQNPSLDNYTAVFRQQPFGLAIRNSLIVAGLSMLVGLLVGCFSAYALARLRFRGKALVLGAVLSIAMFPPIALLNPLFKLFSDLSWIDQYQSMIIPDTSFTLPLTIWILYSFFREMPWELEQAAKVDGATPGQAFRRVILPLAAPGVFTAAILVFIYAWNEFMIALAVTQTYAAKPVTVAIATFTGALGMQQPFGTQMAAGVIVTIPLVILVLLFQRRIVAGLTAGGVKG